MLPGSDLPWEAPLGAFPTPGGDTRFRVWAPRARELALDRDGARAPLEPAGHGVFEAELPAAPGHATTPTSSTACACRTRARAGSPRACAARRACSTPAAFAWTDDGFRAPALRDLVLYELHVGTFTPEGTFEAAIPHLRGLRELGVTAIELMPVAEFPGRHGWGYDGVYISAAHSAYGGPLGLQRLVDAAHAEGLAVILDVVHNHIGASGVKAMEAFGPYLTDKHSTPWGKAINLDDARSDPVREWILQSAERWIRDFHVDGLRLDAVHALRDSNPEHIVAAIARRVHAANPRALVIAESGLNDPKVMRPRRLGLRRRLGRRLPPRAARRADGRDGRLVRGVRRHRHAGQGVPSPARARRDLLELPRAPLRRARRTTSRPSASSSSPPTTTRSATARSATARPPRPGRSPRC